MTKERFKEESRAVLHAVQTGIKYLLEWTYPKMDEDVRNEFKHQRVGIDSAKAEIGAITALLIESGYFSEAKYFDKVLEFYEREKDARTREVREAVGDTEGRINLR